MIINMENTTIQHNRQAYNITGKHTILLSVLLTALLLFAIAYLNKQHKATPVTIPQAIELQWASDTAWVRGWK